MKMESVICTVLVGSALLFTAGCGKDKANATRDYKGLQLQKPTKDSQRDQENLGLLMLPIRLVDNPTFYEGQKGTIKFKLEPDPLITKAELLLSPNFFPEGADLVLNEKTGLYEMSWTPPVGFLGTNFKKEIQVKVEARVVSTPDPERFGILMNYLPVSILVTRNDMKPSILNDTFPTEIEEGEDRDFTITVKNYSFGGSVPNIQLYPWNQGEDKENYTVNAYKETSDSFISKAPITATNPTRVQDADGTASYTYGFSVHTSNRKLPFNKYPKPNDGINLGFVARAVLGNGTTSADKDYSIRVKYFVQQPIVKLSDDPTGKQNVIEIVAGESKTISFIAQSPNGRGVVTVLEPKLKANPATWPSESGGSPKWDNNSCKPVEGVPSAMLCTFDWIPACRLANPKNSKEMPTFDFTASNKRAPAEPKTYRSVMKFKVTGTSDKCIQQPVAPTTPAKTTPDKRTPSKRTPSKKLPVKKPSGETPVDQDPIKQAGV